jgi:hypothetical protein
VIIQVMALSVCILFPELALYLPRRWGFLD